MSKVNSQLNYKVTAEDGGASGIFARIGQELEKTNKQAAKTFGEGSNLGQMGKVLQGAGAIAGFAILGRMLDSTTEKAVAMKDALEAGEKSVAELAEEFASSLPVIGSFWQAGRNIREFFTGEIAAANRELKLAKESAEALIKATAADSKARSFFGATAERAREDFAKAGASPEQAATMTAEKEFQKQMAALMEQRKQIIGDVGASGFSEAARAVEALHRQRLDAIDSEYTERLTKAANAAREIAQIEEDAAKEVRERQLAEMQRVAEVRRRFAEEDAREMLEARASGLEKSIGSMEGNAPRRGALAETVTDLGRGAQLAAMERRSSDPSIGILSRSQRELQQINAQLKAMADAAKQRSRMGQLGEKGVFD